MVSLLNVSQREGVRRNVDGKDRVLCSSLSSDIAGYRCKTTIQLATIHSLLIISAKHCR